MVKKKTGGINTSSRDNVFWGPLAVYWRLVASRTGGSAPSVVALHAYMAEHALDPVVLAALEVGIQVSVGQYGPTFLVGALCLVEGAAWRANGGAALHN